MGSSNIVLVSNAGGSVQGSIDVSWGGKEGTTVDYSFTGRVNDNKGNYAEATVHQNNNGKGGLNITAGHDSKDSSSEKETSSGDRSK